MTLRNVFTVTSRAFLVRGTSAGGVLDFVYTAASTGVIVRKEGPVFVRFLGPINVYVQSHVMIPST